jgi:hypothetical protein
MSRSALFRRKGEKTFVPIMFYQSEDVAFPGLNRTVERLP